MNINQKIKFLKFRRHMDAMRIKRLTDGFLGGIVLIKKMFPKLANNLTFKSSYANMAGFNIYVDLEQIKKIVEKGGGLGGFGGFNTKEILRHIQSAQKTSDSIIKHCRNNAIRYENFKGPVSNIKELVQDNLEDVERAKRVRGILTRIESALT